MTALRLGLVAAACTVFSTAALAQPTPPSSQAPSATATPPAAAPAAPVLPAWTPISPATDLYTTLQGSGQFTTFLKAMDTANLTALLKQPGNLTLFVPTDAAFAAAPSATAQALTKVDTARPVLTYHLVNTRLDAAKVAGAKGPIPTVAGTNVVVDGSAQPVKVNDADVLQSNIVTPNGIIYVVDKVLDPSYRPPAEPAQGAQ